MNSDANSAQAELLRGLQPVVIGEGGAIVTQYPAGEQLAKGQIVWLKTKVL